MRASRLFVFLLVFGLTALPAMSPAGARPSCCGTDCSPCPLQFCKTTRADRALIPGGVALPPLHAPAVDTLQAIHELAAIHETIVLPRITATFRPMRN